MTDKEGEGCSLGLGVLLRGCDFLLSISNMPIERMLPFAIASLWQGPFFKAPLVRKDRAGRWLVGTEDGVKLMAACYVRMHENVCQTAQGTASTLFERSGSDVEKHVAVVRETIWHAYGPVRRMKYRLPPQTWCDHS